MYCTTGTKKPLRPESEPPRPPRAWIDQNRDSEKKSDKLAVKSSSSGCPSHCHSELQSSTVARLSLRLRLGLDSKVLVQMSVSLQLPPGPPPGPQILHNPSVMSLRRTSVDRSQPPTEDETIIGKKKLQSNLQAVIAVSSHWHFQVPQTQQHPEPQLQA